MTTSTATGLPCPTPMRLSVLSAVATGVTSLSAFHRALCRVNVGHYNLIRLSSVIPPGVSVSTSGEPATVRGSWGDRLFCVYAEQRTSTPGEEAWAGVGWVQRVDGGGGLLVEHEGGSEGYVRDAVTKSLNDMVSCDPDHAFTVPELVVTGGRCEDKPIAALVIVAFLAVPWSLKRSDGRPSVGGDGQLVDDPEARFDVGSDRPINEEWGECARNHEESRAG